MKIVAAFLVALPLAAGFSQEASRREAIKNAAAAGVAFLPIAANAAVGESPRFSVFGLIGDGTAMSEGAAYGSDQKDPLYSPYSVYGEVSENSLSTKNTKEFLERKKKVLAETKKRLNNLPGYVEKKKWFEVTTELDRYMYETRGAIRSLATTPAQKKAATEFFKSIEKADLSARRKDQAAAAAAAKDTVAKLDAFTALL